MLLGGYKDNLSISNLNSKVISGVIYGFNILNYNNLLKIKEIEDKIIIKKDFKLNFNKKNLVKDNIDKNNFNIYVDIYNLISKYKKNIDWNIYIYNNDNFINYFSIKYNNNLIFIDNLNSKIKNNL